MRHYLLCFCIILAAFNMLPTDAAADHKESLPFDASQIEKLTSAKYVGLGLIKEDGNVAHKSLRKRSLATLDEGQCTQKYGCLNCSWVRVCAPTSDYTLVEVSRSACPNDRPFCDQNTGACVVDTSSQCMKPSNLTCFKKEGYFPHPTDCKKFIYCSNYTSFLFECIGTYSYSVYSQKCDTYNCYTINCAGNEGRKVAHPWSNSFFAYCSGGSAIAIDRCLGNDILNATSQICEPNCNSEGLIRDTLDCRKYYKCKWEWIGNNKWLIRRHEQCGDGYSFNSEEFQCVPGVPLIGCIQYY